MTWHVRLLKRDSDTKVWAHDSQPAANRRAEALADLHSVKPSVDPKNKNITVDATGYYARSDARKRKRALAS